LVLALPLALCERAARALLHRDVLFNAHAQLLSMAPGRFGSFLRTAYYHLTTHRCPLSVTIGFGSMFTHSEIELGERVVIASGCVIGMANIGDHSMIGDHSHLLSGGRQHGSELGKNYQEQPGVFVETKIGTNCWIGVNCVVFSDVGDNSIVGAGSVVSKPVPANVKVIGSPARVIESAERTSTSSQTNLE
jgi:virginiamycin A acetyltransferase